jgi:transcriptional regulator of arginine metabolism
LRPGIKGFTVAEKLLIIHAKFAQDQVIGIKATLDAVENIIGTIAGDDTVLVVSKKASGGAELAKELLNFGGSKKASGRNTSATRKAKK